LIALSQQIVTPFDGETPRRDAVRTMGAASAALLGLLGLSSSAEVRDKRHSAGSEKKRGKKHKHHKIGLTSAESDPFTLTANNGVTRKATCPDGFVSISGGLQGTTEVTAACQIRESYPSADGTGWNINVFCTQDTNTPLRVGVICFSRNSFNLVA
jgi:hypothetical protein